MQEGNPHPPQILTGIEAKPSPSKGLGLLLLYTNYIPILFLSTDTISETFKVHFSLGLNQNFSKTYLKP